MNTHTELTAPAVWTPLIRLVSDDSGDARNQGPSDQTNAEDASLAGRQILVVEDETIVALDIQYAIEDAGGTVLGPFHQLGVAMAFLGYYEGQVDAAVLDVNLHGEMVFPLATRLDQRGVPFIFHTANGNLPLISSEFAKHPVCEKPTRSETLVKKVAALIA